MRLHRVARAVAILLCVAALLYWCSGMFVGISLWSRGLGAGWGSGFSGWLAIPILATASFGAIALLFFGAILFFLTRIDMNLATARRNSSVPASPPAEIALATAAGTLAALPVEAALPSLVPGATAVSAAAAAPGQEAPKQAVAAVSAGPVAAMAGPGETKAVAAPAIGAATGAIAAGTAAARHEDSSATAGGPQAEIGPLEPPRTETAAVVQGAVPKAMKVPDASELEAELPGVADAGPQEFSGALPGVEEAARIASEMSGKPPPSDPASSTPMPKA
jgi:hypothetical protein